MACLAASVRRGIPFAQLVLGVVHEELPTRAMEAARGSAWEEGVRTALAVPQAIPVLRFGGSRRRGVGCFILQLGIGRCGRGLGGLCLRGQCRYRITRRLFALYDGDDVVYGLQCHGRVAEDVWNTSSAPVIIASILTPTRGRGDDAADDGRET